MEDWLYEEGEDETKGVYIAKLEELKKVRSFAYKTVTVTAPVLRQTVKLYKEKGIRESLLLYPCVFMHNH